MKESGAMTKARPDKATIFIYCSPEEKALILKASFKAEKNMSVYCRDTLVKASRRLLEVDK